MKIAKNETVVGGFLLVAIAASAAFLVAKAGAQGWARGTKRFTIEAASGKNLREEAPVRMRGIQVGVVEAIDMDARSQVRVTFRVEPKYARNVKTDAFARVIEPPILGTSFIDLDPGTPELDVHPGGGLRTMPEPSLFANLEESVADVKKIVSQVSAFVEDAAKTMKEVNAMAREVSPADVGTIVRNAARASEDLAETTAAIRRREGAVGRLLADDTLVRESEMLVAKTRESLAAMDRLTVELTAQLQKISARLDSTGVSFENLKTVVDNTARLSGELAILTERINQGKGTLGKLMNDDAIFVEAKGVLKELRESVQDLREQAPINSFIGVVFSAF